MNTPLIEYDAPSTAPPSGTEDKLPFDPLTVLRGVLRRKWWILGWWVVCGVLGAAAGWLLAPRYWESEAVIMYQPPSAELLAGLYTPPTMRTQLNMVKVKNNLAETRLRLALPCTLEELGSACKVTIPKETQLMVFQVRWSHPDQAAKIANTLSAVFQKSQHRLQRKELAAVINEVEARLTKVSEKIRKSGGSDSALRGALLRKEKAKQLHREWETMKRQAETLRIDEQAVRTQQAHLDALIAAERATFAKSQAAAAQSESLSALNMRAERITKLIEQKRTTAINKKDEQQWKQRMRHSRRLHAQGIISNTQWQAEQDAYEKWQLATQDSDEIKKLKDQLGAIYDAMLLRGKPGMQVSPKIQQLETQRQQLTLKLKELAVQIEGRRKSAAKLEQEYHDLLFFQPRERGPDPRLVSEWRKEEDELSDALANLRAIGDSDKPDFRVVTKAIAPRAPAKSYRKLVFAGIAGFGALLGLFCIGGYEALDTTVKSRAEIGLRLDLPVLGMLPNVQAGADNQLPPGWEECLLEPIRGVVRRVRSQLPQKGARLFIVSNGASEGCTTIAGHLARCFGQQGENVLLLDGDVRGGVREQDLNRVIVPDSDQQLGLGDWLTENTKDLDAIRYDTTLYGVQCIPRSHNPVVPELLSSRPMFDLMDHLSQEHDVILVDGPPASSNADSEILSAQTDGILLVVQSRRFRAAELKKSIDRLAATGTPILGVVLNRVDPLFMDSNWQ